MDVKDVCMPMGVAYEALVKASRLKGGQEKEKEEMDQEKCFYQYYGRTMDHSHPRVPRFLKIIQELMNEGEMEFCGKMEE